ncbi:hypothetical protein HYPSUDRAFT_210174 [Hypholoma sublateritium FD-334 SS-4]|uniref:Uncharacterized protein n=1 Tax=Hypholoma sublateritium (strain FD-334 SS-4) TaxID=945553 RepID=A0A0D2LPP5_HYPSF|nr:hypothetical protein HYPSUDRAFT_210174 [Hypholoma sublateritium FD-334 SS-4]
MTDEPSFASGDNRDDMYIGDEVSKDCLGQSSSKDTGHLTSSEELKTIRDGCHLQNEKRLKDRICSLEQEVIKLQLWNMQLTATTPGPGASQVQPLFSFIPADVPQVFSKHELAFMRMGDLPLKPKMKTLKLRGKAQGIKASMPRVTSTATPEDNESPVILEVALVSPLEIISLNAIQPHYVAGRTQWKAAMFHCFWLVLMACVLWTSLSFLLGTQTEHSIGSSVSTPI